MTEVKLTGGYSPGLAEKPLPWRKAMSWLARRDACNATDAIQIDDGASGSRRDEADRAGAAA